jgi:pyruvate formate lyase activating enzyme
MTSCRREFLKTAALVPALGWGAENDARFVREARFYEKLPHRKIRCKLCPRECVIDDRERGYCGVRENRGGVYYTLVHSRVAAAHIDPVEKKPLFHFLPGTMAFSIATAGCNVNCKMCQNWDLSQARPEQVGANYMPPAAVADAARENRCASIAYTYSEPVVWHEYLSDTAEAGRAAGVRSVAISNGYIQREPLLELAKRVDAIKIDLKAFSESFYKDVVNGELKPVLQSISTIRKLGVWNEIVYLVIPGLNDGDREFQALARWVKTELGPAVPLHFSRYYPEYLLKNLPPTPLATLERAKAICDAEGLEYVYIGNVPAHPAASTYCPKCRKAVIERTGFVVRAMHLRKGKCGFCQNPIAGVWT